VIYSGGPSWFSGVHEVLALPQEELFGGPRIKEAAYGPPYSLLKPITEEAYCSLIRVCENNRKKLQSNRRVSVNVLIRLLLFGDKMQYSEGNKEVGG